jgi:hypothetical protein
MLSEKHEKHERFVLLPLSLARSMPQRILCSVGFLVARKESLFGWWQGM